MITVIPRHRHSQVMEQTYWLACGLRPVELSDSNFIGIDPADQITSELICSPCRDAVRQYHPDLRR